MRYNVGLTHLYAGNYVEAEGYLTPLLSTAEMGDDLAVLYNTAATLNRLGRIDEARSVLARFVFPPVAPTALSLRDIVGKAYWLGASLESGSPDPNCERVSGSVASAVAMAPGLRGQILADSSLDTCENAKEGL